MPEITSTKYLVSAGWDDVPHLTEEAKREMLGSTPPYLREARSKGVPQLGSGVIYPIPEDQVIVSDIEIPAFWPRAYGMDVGWNCTAAVWGAWDRSSDVVYLYSVYKAGQEKPPVHADAIRARGVWIPGVIDPASRGRNQNDGSRLMDIYIDLGLDLSKADNAVEAGLLAIWRRLTSGRLKVFKSLYAWFDEYRLYRRDDNGKVVKESDHLMDATRYLIMSGMALGVSEVIGTMPVENRHDIFQQTGRNLVTGY